MRWTWVSVVVAAVVLLAEPARPQEASLEFESVRVEKGEVRFNSTLVGEVSPTDPKFAPGASLQRFKTENHSVCLDLGDIQPEPKYNSYYSYHFYVLGGGRSRHFLVQGTSVGSFPPQRVDVPFTLYVDGKAEVGRISIPAFSSEPPVYLASAPPESFEVGFSSAGEILLPLENRLPNLRVEVLEVGASANPGLWKSVSAGLAGEGGPGSPILLKAGGTLQQAVRIIAIANPWEAFKRSVLKRKRSAADDEIKLAIKYKNPWEAPQNLEVTVPVLFVPSFLSLFLAMASGTLLGTSLRASESYRRWRRLHDRKIRPSRAARSGRARPRLARRVAVKLWWRWVAIFGGSFVTALLISLLAEAIAIFLVQMDSRLRLFGVDVDPFQLVSVFVLSGLIALAGRRALTWLRRIQNRSTKEGEVGKES